jgi:hypothetical protein
MATPFLAATAAAFGLYVYMRRASDTPQLSNVDHPPDTWSEAIYYAKEVFRCDPRPLSMHGLCGTS